ncbi:MAG: hypothetical protein ASARMPRED_007701 [Alectoria sarmentosa]|nr:MAG: hypothetical protein ASARMPRED_007701 [Alectoria sarmentosa]
MLTPQGLEGCILFLKKIANIHSYYLEKYDLEPSVFWHPVLVLQTHEATSEATICIVSVVFVWQQRHSTLIQSLRQLTTLNDRNAEDRFPSSGCHLYLAVWPKHPPFDGQPQLNLQGNATLRKPGYISIQREYLVHQSMLQHYDWDEPMNYYRLTQKSFAVVVAKLDSIYHLTRLAKLNAEEFARKAAKSREKESAAKVAKLAAEARKLMAEKRRLVADRSPLPPNQPRSNYQPESADPRVPVTATTTKAIRVKNRTHASFGKTKLLVFVVLLAALQIWVRSSIVLPWAEWYVRRYFETLMQSWARRTVDPTWGEWLVRRALEALMEVWMVALAISWEVEKLIIVCLSVLAKIVVAWGGWILRRIISALVQVTMAARTPSGIWIDAGHRVIEKAVKELMDR